MSKTTTTTPKSRRGWSATVSQIKDQSQQEDLRAFNQSILDLQCKIVAAEYGALWVKDPSGDMKLIDVWPSRMSEDAQPDDLPVFELLSEAAKAGFEREASYVLKVELEGATDDAPGVGAHVFVTALRVGEQLVAIATVVADCRDPGVVHSTVPMRELAGGLYELFFARQETRQKTPAGTPPPPDGRGGAVETSASLTSETL